MLHTQSIIQLRDDLIAKKISAVEVAQHFLKRIASNAELNAFISIDEAATLAQAQRADAAIANGSAGACWCAVGAQGRVCYERVHNHSRLKNFDGL